MVLVAPESQSQLSAAHEPWEKKVLANPCGLEAAGVLVDDLEEVDKAAEF